MAYRFEQWIVEEELGSGSLGLNRRVRHELTNATGLMKMIPAGAGMGRLLRELSVLKVLRGARIAQVLDSGLATDGDGYVVVEWIEGRSLRQILDQDGQPTEARVLDLARSLAETLRE